MTSYSKRGERYPQDRANCNPHNVLRREEFEGTLSDTCK